MAKTAPPPAPSALRRHLETARAFALAILLAFGIRSFLVEPFTIPSGSMIPTLLVGDFILVNKFVYGLRLPITGTLLLPLGAPQRGDVIVFRYPDDPSQDFIKRVVALPGERVEIRGGRPFVNGQPLDRIEKGAFTYYDVENSRPARAQRACERARDDLVYPVLQHPGMGVANDRGPWVVPEGAYFMMGDNRDNSRDSRFWSHPFVLAEQIKGKAWRIHWSWLVASGRRPDNPILSILDTLARLVTFRIEEVRWGRFFQPVDGGCD
jgi:signal peptidase I